MKDYEEDFADLLGRYRVRAGLKQQELAHNIGVHRNTIVKWENRTSISQPDSRGQVLLLADELILSKEERKALIQAARFPVERWPTSFWTVPVPRDMFFTGRGDIFQSLQQSLVPGSTTALTQAISGLGGIGKTHIAAEYAYRFHQYYDAVLWLQADSWEILLSECIQLADELGIPEQEEARKTVEEVQRWLRKHRCWLLVLDNVENPQEILSKFLPTNHQGSVLITTRVHNVEPLAQTQVLALMPEQEGVLFLLRRTKKIALGAELEQTNAEVYDEARQIWQLLDRLPLALDQAGAYILETGCSFSSYQEQYVSQRATLLQRRGKRFIGHEASVATTFSLTFQRIEALDPRAADILRACALLHSEGIPERLFEAKMPEGEYFLAMHKDLPQEGKAGLGPLLGIEREHYNSAISVLLDYSLVQRNAHMKSLAVHRLVQAVLQETLSEQEYVVWLHRVITALDIVFSGAGYTPWKQYEHLIPHALICASQTSSRQIDNLHLADLFCKIGGYFQNGAQYDEAEKFYLRSAHMYDRWFPDQKGANTAYIGLANLYSKQGKYSEAEALFRRALDIWGSDNPAASFISYGLTTLYMQQGKYSEAKALCLRILDIWEQQRGPEDPQLAQVLNSLGKIYGREEKYSEAESCLQRALHIWEHSLDSEHPDLLYPLGSLADVYFRQKKYGEAEDCYQRALRIGESTLGSEHPEVTFSLCGLANLYFVRGQYDDAELLYLRALCIREQTLGSEHPAVVHLLGMLGNRYIEQGKFSEAESLLQRALRIREQAGASGHPDVADLLSDLVDLSHKQGKYEEARLLLHRVLRLREQTLGPEHPQVTFLLNELGNLYIEQCKYKEAEPLFLHVLRIREEAWQADCIDVTTPLNELSDLYIEQGKFSEAESLLQRALRIREQAGASGHPDVADLLAGLANLSHKQGKYKEAEPLFLQALYIREQALGSEHSGVAFLLNELGNLYIEQGKFSEAESPLLRSLHIREQGLEPDYINVAASLNSVGSLYIGQSKFSEAEPLLKRALHILEQIGDSEHLDIVYPLTNLADLYHKQGKLAEAEALYRQGLGIREQKLGAQHPRWLLRSTIWRTAIEHMGSMPKLSCSMSVRYTSSSKH